MTSNRSGGFTLVELTVVMAVIAILAGMALPAWQGQLLRAGRSDATTALLRIAAAQERFFISHGRYAGPTELQSAPPAGLGVAGTDRGMYRLTLAAAPDGLVGGYQVSAVASSGRFQFRDQDCREFRLSQSLERLALNAAGTANPECWR